MHYSNKNSEMFQDEQDVGNEETYFRIKKLLSWQNFLSKRQIQEDIEKKWPNQKEVLRRGISPIDYSSSRKWKPCHGAINSRPRNVRTALEKYFPFHWNCKQLQIEARNSMVNSEIYFPNFSETIHTILLKLYIQCFHSMIWGRLGKGRCKKIGFRCFSQNFWPGCLSAFNNSIWNIL